MTHEVKATENFSMVSGMWKFRDTVPRETLGALAVEWKKTKPDQYVDLHVRGCSKNQHGIVFKFLLPKPGKQAHDKFFHAMKDRLKRRFGDDFVGWDIASPTLNIE